MTTDSVHKLASSASGESTTPKQHENVWFLDGDIVLQTKTYLFRVHKTVLSNHSSVFKGMFEPPIGEDVRSEDSREPVVVAVETEQYEGVPLVVLADDEGEDVSHLLRTVYEDGYYVSSSDDHPLEKIAALLVLSSKYDFEGIRRDVVNHLLRLYPTSLEEYEAAERNFRKFFQGTRESNHVRLLKYALIAGIDILLPQLYYACSDFKIGVILRNHKEHLDAETLVIILEGRELLAKRIQGVVWTYVSHSESCIRVCNAPPFDEFLMVGFERFRLEYPDPVEASETKNLQDVSGRQVSRFWPERISLGARTAAVKD